MDIPLILRSRPTDNKQKIIYQRKFYITVPNMRKVCPKKANKSIEVIGHAKSLDHYTNIFHLGHGRCDKDNTVNQDKSKYKQCSILVSNY